MIELLVVIAIMGILAAIAVPSFKNIGKGHAVSSASRQMLDDIARARQLAIAHRTTVYMVFVPPNFWDDSSYFLKGYGNTDAWRALMMTPNGLAEQEKARNLLDKQAAAYTFITLRSVGDQPGRGTVHYLSPWKNLPEGTFVMTNKFLSSQQNSSARRNFVFSTPDNGGPGTIYSFQATNIFPFPSEQSPMTTQPFWLPYISFNYLGQVTSGQDEYIPLAQGAVGYVRDPNTQFDPTSLSSGVEKPPGNSTSSYNLIHIDWLTGRARVEQQQVQ